MFAVYVISFATANKNLYASIEMSEYCDCENGDDVLSFVTIAGQFQMSIHEWDQTPDYVGPGAIKAVGFCKCGFQYELLIAGPNAPFHQFQY